MFTKNERTVWQKFKHWFWCSRVGMGLNLLLGNTTAYKLHTVDGALCPTSGAIIVDCFIENSYTPICNVVNEFGDEV